MEVKLSDNIRRLICRAGFLLICLLPTLMVVRWIMFPVSTDQWNARMEQQLGIATQIGSVTTKTPQQTNFGQLRIGADEFRSRVTIDTIVMKNVADARVIQVGTVTGSVQAIATTLNRIEQSSNSYSRRSHRPIHVQADRIVFRRDDDPDSPGFELSNVTMRIDRPGNCWQLEFSPGTRQQSPAVCSIQRTAGANQVSWQVRCTDQPLPGWIVHGFCPALRFVDPNALITGQATMFLADGRWSGEIGDLHLSAVDLEQLVQRRFGQRLSGQARLQIHSATIVDNQMFKITGELYSQSGVVGAGLLNACQECAAMRIVAPWGASDMEYTELNFGFRMNHFELAVTAPATTDSILMATDGSKVLIPRNGHPLPVTSLLAVLSWPRNQFAPINRETAALAGCIAWPALPHEYSNQFSNEQIADEQSPQIGEGIFR